MKHAVKSRYVTAEAVMVWSAWEYLEFVLPNICIPVRFCQMHQVNLNYKSGVEEYWRSLVSPTDHEVLPSAILKNTWLLLPRKTLTFQVSSKKAYNIYWWTT